MLCKFRGRGGGTRNKQMISTAQIGKFLWTQVQRCPQAVAFVRPLFLYPMRQQGNKTIRVVDMSQAQSPPTQVEFSTSFVFSNINQGPSQSTVDPLSHEEQAVSGKHWPPSRAPEAPPSWDGCCWEHPALGTTLPPPPSVLLQLVEFCRVRGHACFEPGTLRPH